MWPSSLPQRHGREPVRKYAITAKALALRHCHGFDMESDHRAICAATSWLRRKSCVGFASSLCIADDKAGKVS
jgi:hypothetical protein